MTCWWSPTKAACSASIFPIAPAMRGRWRERRGWCRRAGIRRSSSGARPSSRTAFDGWPIAPMRPLDYDAWVAVRSIGEAATRTKSAAPADLIAHLKSPDFELAAFKGRKLTLSRMGWAAAPADPDRDRKAAGDASRRNRASCTNSPSSTRSASTSRRPIAGPTRLKRHARTEERLCVTFQSGRARRRLCLAAWLAARPTAASAYTVFVTNEKDNTVSIIDSAKLEVVKTVKVGQRPRGVTLSKDHRWLLICASDDNSVQVYDARTMEFVKSLAVRAGPGAVRAASFRQSALHRQRGRQPRDRGRHREGHRCWRKSRSAWSPRAWASARTASSWWRRRKPPTWRTSSTPRPTRPSTMSWSTAGRASPSSPPTAAKSGSAPRSAAR